MLKISNLKLILHMISFVFSHDLILHCRIYVDEYLHLHIYFIVLYGIKMYFTTYHGSFTSIFSLFFVFFFIKHHNYLWNYPILIYKSESQCARVSVSECPYALRAFWMISFSLVHVRCRYRERETLYTIPPSTSLALIYQDKSQYI